MSGTAFVTGGARRLGRVILEDLARDHPVIVHHNRSADDALALCDGLRGRGGAAERFQADLSDLENHYARIVSLFRDHDVRVLVNSASIFEHDTLKTLSVSSLNRHMAVNCLAPCLLIRALAEALPEDGEAAVVNILDHKLQNLNPDHLSYTVSKASLATVTEMAARALAPRIRVNAVSPGYVLPAPEQSVEDFDRVKVQSPLGRNTSPEDIARAVRFLVEARSVTGETLAVDAGERFISRARDYSFR